VKYDGRYFRRMAGYLAVRLQRAKLDEVEDRRRRQGRRRSLESILKTVLLGLMGGCKSLRDIEVLSESLSPAIRQRLGIKGRLPDTTARDALVRLEPFEVRRALHAVIDDAHRRKAIEPEQFPFGVLALDGKSTAISCWDHHYAQMQTGDERMRAHGVVRTVSCALVSARAKPCIDAIPIPAETNEMGIFAHVFESMERTYGQLFQLVTYDAGAASTANGRLVVAAGKDYLFRVKDDRHFLYQRIVEVIGPASGDKPRAVTPTPRSNKRDVVRTLYIARACQGYRSWEHVRTVLRVNSRTLEDGRLISEEDRYYVSSLEEQALSHEQWLALVRNHWAVENNCHNTLDKFFEEDDHPVIEQDPRGVATMMVLRRIAYTLLTLFKNVTQRSEKARSVTWRDLLASVWMTLVAATQEQLDKLRPRKGAATL
jgi:hypothetical protein